MTADGPTARDRERSPRARELRPKEPTGPVLLREGGRGACREGKTVARSIFHQLGEATTCSPGEQTELSTLDTMDHREDHQEA